MSEETDVDRFKTAMRESDAFDVPLEARSVFESYDVIVARTILEVIERLEALEAAAR